MGNSLSDPKTRSSHFSATAISLLARILFYENHVCRIVSELRQAINAHPFSVLVVARDVSVTSELLRIHPLADDKRYMRIPLIDFDYRLVVLSSFIVIIATYATLVVVERMNSARGTGWFAWLGGGASGIGIGIWSMHYLGLQSLSLPVPALDCSSVVCSILATIFASGITLLVIGGKSDSGRSVKEENQRSMRLEIFICN
jgi:hypothetical protein